jgi:CRISPR/Cas system-associated exonuclease Cas4 (RecB family)
MGETAERIDSRSLRVFAIGHLLHELFQTALEEGGVLISKEIEVEDNEYGEGIFGHYDALLDPFVGDEKRPVIPPERKGEDLILIDIKSVNSNKFHYMDKTHQVDSHYVKQIHEYCMTLRKNGYPGLEDCRLVYVSKDDGVTREVNVPLTDRGQREVTEELTALMGYWERQEVPPPVPQMDWECKYCPFKKICPRGQEILQIEAQKEAKTLFL